MSMPWAEIYAQSEGWTVTIDGSNKFGGYLVNVYTPAGATWKIRASVFKYQAGP